jgi:hypothetical protein
MCAHALTHAHTRTLITTPPYCILFRAHRTAFHFISVSEFATFIDLLIAAVGAFVMQSETHFGNGRMYNMAGTEDATATAAVAAIAASGSGGAGLLGVWEQTVFTFFFAYMIART